MPKLYIFGIGGTGSRVLRSLTMLLAAGVDTRGYDVAPIIIDPDAANADLTQCVSLIKLYRSIREHLTFTDKATNTFFKTEISHPLSQDYNIPLAQTSNKKFQEFIGKSTMPREDQAMAEMLFSETNLGSSMEVGFKGNPNIGSVVLNQISTTREFIDFANAFSEGDKIFIISSIFGGTGASGFPLLLKTLRQNRLIPNAGLINAAEIGAITVLPYFNLKQDAQSEIDSSTFYSKTRAALKYYINNVASANALYFIGDTPSAQYDNCEGGAGQGNDANLIELLAATAILDFCHNSFPQGSTSYRELGLNDNVGTVTLQTLPIGTMRNALAYPLIELTLFAKSLVDDYDYVSSEKLKANKSLATNIYSTQFVQNVREMLQRYKEWLHELQGNKPEFAPFNLGGELCELVIGGKAKKGIFSRKLDKDYFRSELNGAKLSGISDEQNFLELYCQAATKIAKEKYTF